MGEGVIQDDIAVAERALAEYDLAPDSALSLLNLSENATYAVEDAGAGTRSILRVHRQNYHLAHEIESELDWLDALRRDSDLTVPNVLPASDGRRVVTVNVDGTPRYVVHFEMVAGVEPDEASLTVEDFHTLGWITAVLHEHSHAWTRPSGFSRFSWDWEHSLGDEPRWGRWQDADGVGRQENDLLDRAARLLQQRLTDYGSGQDRFGLVHADLRLANLLVDGSAITVIDFDDCGFGYWLYDIAVALWELRHRHDYGQFRDALINGYTQHRPLPGDLTLLDDFIASRDVAFGLWFTGTAQANPAFRADLHEVQQNISHSLDTLTRH